MFTWKQNVHKLEVSLDNIDDALEAVKKMAEKTASCWALPGLMSSSFKSNRTGLNIGIVEKNQTYTMTAGLDKSLYFCSRTNQASRHQH